MRTSNNFSSKQNEIVKIALQLFLGKGYENTKISDILMATELSKGGMYHYFASKEAILDAVIEYAQEEQRPLFEKDFFRSTNTLEQLSCFIRSDVLSKSDFREKIIVWKKNEDSLFVKYRIRELNTIFEIPYMQTLIENGIKEKIFHTQYSKEVSRYLYLIGEDIFSQLSTLTNLKEREQNEIMTNMNAFLEIVFRTLLIDPKNQPIIAGILQQEVAAQINTRRITSESIND